MNEFSNLLQSWQGTWKRGLRLSAALGVGFWFLMALVLYGFCDRFLAFEERTRVLLGVLFLGFAVAALIARLIAVRRVSLEDTARRADGALNNRRQPVLTALELGKSQTGAQTGSEAWLISQSVEKARRDLAGLPASDAYPRPEVTRNLRRLLFCAGGAGVILILCWPVAQVVVPRLVFPWSDRPPYSPLRFALDPERPEVFYGEDLAVAAVITGGSIHREVSLLTRGPNGSIHRTACFQESQSRFAQRLEKVVQPVEFCFAVGRARSPWRPVELRLQPKIALASVCLEPPAYSGLAQSSFLAGTAPLEGLHGTGVQLAVTSNRPLAGGELVLCDPENGKPVRSIAGEPTGPQTVAFRWKLEDDASLDVRIRDVRGVGNPEPYRLRQKVRPDRPPEVTLHEPQPLVLATPSISIPLSATVTDDLCLKRVELVRNLVGYRDRVRSLVAGGKQKDFSLHEGLNLAGLGVQPGDVMEFFVEAEDSNPNLLGASASEVGRVKIISEEEYADKIRTETTVQEFVDRYYLVQEALQKLQDALKALEANPDAGNLERARAAANPARDLLQKLAKDFAAFDLEKSLIAQAAQSANRVAGAAQRLEQLKAGQTQTSEAAREIAQQLEPDQEAFNRQAEEADEVAQVAKVLEAAAEFSKLLSDQEALERRMRRFCDQAGSGSTAGLKAMGQEQAALAGRLKSFRSNLAKAAQGLPLSEKGLQDSAMAFAQKLDGTKAGADMTESGSRAGGGDGTGAHQFASLAQEKLRSLVEGSGAEGNGSDKDGTADEFASLCRGRGKFGSGGGEGEGEGKGTNLKRTLEQMLAAIFSRGKCMRPGGKGEGEGEGQTGIGGDLQDGYHQGFSQANIPVLGPQRMRLGQPSRTGTQGKGDGKQIAASHSPGAAKADSDLLSQETLRTIQSRSMQIERVPEKYRDALKRYFSNFGPNGKTR